MRILGIQIMAHIPWKTWMNQLLSPVESPVESPEGRTKCWFSLRNTSQRKSKVILYHILWFYTIHILSYIISWYIYIYSIWFLSYYQLCVSYVVHVCIIWFLYRTYTVYLRWSPEAGSDSLHHRCGAPWGEGASDSMGIYIYILYIYAIYTIRYILLDIYY